MSRCYSKGYPNKWIAFFKLNFSNIQYLKIKMQLLKLPKQ